LDFEFVLGKNLAAMTASLLAGWMAARAAEFKLRKSKVSVTSKPI